MDMTQCRIIEFPKISDKRGHLSFIEERKHVPFEIKRIYYLYDAPKGAIRGGHAHRTLEQVIIALSGSFEVILDDGHTRQAFRLNKPNHGLYVPPGIWREMEKFSSNSVALVVASMPYDEGDYIRDYQMFKKMVRNRRRQKEKN